MDVIEMTHLFTEQVVNCMLEVSLTSGGRTQIVAACFEQIQNAAIRNT